MAIQDEIKKAIGAHGLWKARLRGAIDTGKSEWPVDAVAKDNQCEFGRWIHSLPAGGAHVAKVKDLHAKFHAEAASVLKLVEGGQKDAARQAIAAGSKFDRLTNDLTKELMEWSKAA